MREYYIYMLELMKDKERRYYIGKTHKLEKRLNDHIRLNSDTAETLKACKLEGYEVVTIKEIHRVYGRSKGGSRFSKSEIDSITSRLENKFITEKIIDDIGNKTKYRGGDYLSEDGCWQGDDFELKDLELDEYKKDLEDYKLIEVINDRSGVPVREVEKEYNDKVKQFIDAVMLDIEKGTYYPCRFAIEG